jgi:hypothetical protein
MSDSTAAPAPDTAAEATTTDAPPATTDAAHTADEVAKWKAMARKHEADAKANAAAAKRLQELDDANKSEVQKATDRAAAAEAEATRWRTSAARSAIAAETAVPVDLITGDDEDAMRAAAKAAVAWRDAAVAAATPQPATGRPVRVIDPAALSSGAAAGGATTGKERAAEALRSVRSQP